MYGQSVQFSPSLPSKDEKKTSFRLLNVFLKSKTCCFFRQLSPYFKHRNVFTKYLNVTSTSTTTSSTTSSNLNNNKPPPTPTPPPQSPSLLRFLLSQNSLDLIISFTIQLYKGFAGFVPPYCLQQILRSLESSSSNSNSNPQSEPYVYALVVFVAHCSFAQVDLFDAWHGRRAYERTRGVMFCALHWKALKRRDMSGKTIAQKKGRGDGGGGGEQADGDGDGDGGEQKQKQLPSDIGRYHTRFCRATWRKNFETDHLNVSLFLFSSESRI